MAASLCKARIANVRYLAFLSVQWKNCKSLVRCLSFYDRLYSSNSANAIQISDPCVKRLKEVLTGDEKYLRVVVDGGGCSGFQYVFKLDKTLGKDDCVIEKDGVKVVVDKMSLEFMQGATVDYSEELIRSSFRVLNNPKAEKGCSCGASFNVKGI